MGSEEQSADMKTTLLFLSCLLVISGALFHKDPCWHKVAKAARENCKEECDTAKPSRECGRCIINHEDCKLGFVEKCTHEFEDKSKRERCEHLSTGLFYHFDCIKLKVCD